MKKISKLFNFIFTSCFLCFTTGFDWTIRQCKEIVKSFCMSDQNL